MRRCVRGAGAPLRELSRAPFGCCSVWLCAPMARRNQIAYRGLRPHSRRGAPTPLQRNVSSQSEQHPGPIALFRPTAASEGTYRPAQAPRENEASRPTAALREKEAFRPAEASLSELRSSGAGVVQAVSWGRVRSSSGRMWPQAAKCNLSFARHRRAPSSGAAPFSARDSIRPEDDRTRPRYRPRHRLNHAGTAP